MVLDLKGRKMRIELDHWPEVDENCLTPARRYYVAVGMVRKKKVVEYVVQGEALVGRRKTPTVYTANLPWVVERCEPVQQQGHREVPHLHHRS